MFSAALVVFAQEIRQNLVNSASKTVEHGLSLFFFLFGGEEKRHAFYYALMRKTDKFI